MSEDFRLALCVIIGFLVSVFFLSLTEKKFINDIEWLLKNLLKQEDREDQFEVECIIGNADVWINLVAFRYTGEGEQACPHFLCVKYL